MGEITRLPTEYEIKLEGDRRRRQSALVIVSVVVLTIVACLILTAFVLT